MNLRPELTPPPISKERRKEIRRRIEVICYLVDFGSDASDLIEEFNRFTGRDYTAYYFRKFGGVMSLGEFVREASRPIPQPVADVSIEELIEVVRRAMQISDPDFDFYREIFEANVPMPKASNLISYPLDYDTESNTWGGGRPIGEYDPTPEEIVHQALSSGNRDTLTS